MIHSSEVLPSGHLPSAEKSSSQTTSWKRLRFGDVFKAALHSKAKSMKKVVFRSFVFQTLSTEKLVSIQIPSTYPQANSTSTKTLFLSEATRSLRCRVLPQVKWRRSTWIRQPC
jgi:hypothetical protein